MVFTLWLIVAYWTQRHECDYDERKRRSLRPVGDDEPEGEDHRHPETRTDRGLAPLQQLPAPVDAEEQIGNGSVSHLTPVVRNARCTMFIAKCPDPLALNSQIVA